MFNIISKAEFDYNDFSGYVFIELDTVKADYRVSVSGEYVSFTGMPSKRLTNEADAKRFYNSVCAVIFSGKIEAHQIALNKVWSN